MPTRSIITSFEINERETAEQFIRALEKSRNKVMKGQEKIGNTTIKVKELKGKEKREFLVYRKVSLYGKY